MSPQTCTAHLQEQLLSKSRMSNLAASSVPCHHRSLSLPVAAAPCLAPKDKSKGNSSSN
ncbi:unnamed protein product [Nyctereutes procyonoides]|uniref:(raccoon dog) hypothetical protein n=1 Tax=Nyctereutes procyonoides TaxID=34880 RepID=A0A811Z860_NYCPR|nr:unnamed protein product [Nyctereutes procyonoides]